MDVRQVVDRLVPPGTTRRAALRLGRQLAYDGLGYARRARALWAVATAPEAAEPDYAAFLRHSRVSAEELLHQTSRAAEGQLACVVECVVLAPPGSGAALSATLRSLQLQTFGGWSAVVVGEDAGAVADQRVRWADPAGDAAAVVARLMSEGDRRAFVLVLEAGDRIEPDLLFRIAATVTDDPSVDLVHWDDDLLSADGTVREPLFRPSWSPDMLLGANYLGRSFAVRRERVAEAGGLRPQLGDGSWWDLLLRLGLEEGSVARLPKVLSHLRRRPVVPGDLAVEIVQGHLDRLGRPAEVSSVPTGVRVRWVVADPPHVTIVIPTRHNRAMLSTCLAALARTDYPSFDVRIVDNGARTPENEAWYSQFAGSIDVTVSWWEEPFNYSAVNNAAAAEARGEVLLFLNDDTEPTDPGWLAEMVGWVQQPGIGLVGAQLIGPDGLIQHGGVILGMNGFADHLFEGVAPGTDTPFGPTGWYRDLLSVTAACVAVRRELFERIGGFDERFVLCGSDVVLGLDSRFHGYRNVCTPYALVRHLESATRGSDVPTGDFFASYWRYQKWLRAGDPYFTPNLSLHSRVPRFAAAGEPPPLEKVGEVLNRSFKVFRQTADGSEAAWLAEVCRADDRVAAGVRSLHAANTGAHAPQTINWFVPDIDSPFYGGINTALRLADHLARTYGVRNQFVVMAAANEPFFRSALAAAFPSLAGSPIAFIDGPTDPALDAAPPADVSIATLWVTAYSVARFRRTRRKMYLIQDFEPMFYPAGTQYALAEESYRLGLYGLCNTDNLLRIYRDNYGGEGFAFTPAVDRSVFHPDGRSSLDHDGPVRVFVYARPGHWRNCWELAEPALARVKERFGDGVHIVTAGSWATPDDLGRGIQHLGLLDYRETGQLYRTCDVGVALTVSAHPSYLPLELMACGVPVVAFDNPAGDWILHHGENSLRCRRTVDGLAEAIGTLVADPALRVRLGARGLEDIAARHGDWDAAFEGIYEFLTDPGPQP
jgi:GT2 family glycosyltransferase/glycosyltransferase involved in cell wall biosynthesis